MALKESLDVVIKSNVDGSKRYIVVSGDGYRALKDAIEIYEGRLRLEAEAVLKKMDVDKFETKQYTIQKVKRGTKKPVDGLKEGMVGVKQELVQDTKALNDYVKENGKLPDGWVEVVSEYIKFTIK